MADLPDINVWVSLAYAGHAHHDLASKWFDAVPVHGALFCRITQLGLLRLITNKKVMGGMPLDAIEAWQVYDAFRADNRVIFETDPLGLEVSWRWFARARKGETNLWTPIHTWPLLRSLAVIA